MLNLRILVFSLILAGIFSNEFDCNSRSTPFENKCKLLDLQSTRNVCKPYVLYNRIDAVHVKANLVPDYVFSNYCINFLQLSFNELSEFSPNSFTGILYLSRLILQHNKISSLMSLIHSLRQINTLNEIDLSNNKIQRLDVKFTSNFQNLTILYLRLNSIDFISDRVFENLVSLEVLQLDYNNLKQIGNLAFYNLVKLKKLILESNILENMDAQAFNSLVQLTQLILNKNNLKNVDQILSPLENLEDLRLVSNKIVYIRPDLFKNMSKLIHLELSKNNLNITKISFNGLSNLREFSFSQLNIEVITEKIFEGLWNLFELKIEQSKVLSIQKNAFRNLNNLNSLSLSGNMIKSLQNGIFEGIYELTELNIDHNVVSNLEQMVFQPLKSLRTIDMTQNMLETIPSGIFSNLNSLKRIDLSKNRINRLGNGFLCDLEKLEEVNLDKNEIKLIELNAFQNLTRIKKLYLSFNQLKQIRNYYFQRLDSLEEIWLNRNRVNYIEQDSFAGLENINILDLSDNFIIDIEVYAFRNLRCQFLNLTKTQLDDFNPEIFVHSNITTVLFKQNYFRSLSFGSLCHLGPTTSLSLSYNQIESISNELFCLNQVELLRIYLDHNLLRDLSFLKVNYFSRLVHLDVSFNLIKSIRLEDFKYLDNLKSLVIRSNSIKHIDAEIFELPFLKRIDFMNLSMPINLTATDLTYIDLSHNEIVDFGFLLKQDSIETLYLRNVKFNFGLVRFLFFINLTQLDFAENADDGNFTLSQFENLENVNLSEMNLSLISRFEFEKFANLYHLNLSKNKIERINEADVACETLTDLDLSFNYITWIDPNSFVKLISLTLLDLKNNRIKIFNIYLNSMVFSNLNLNGNAFLKEINILSGDENVLSQIEVIDFSSNSLNSIDFNQMTSSDCKLKELYLNRNRIKSINPRYFTNFNILLLLHLDSNSIETIELDTFRSLDQLVYLSLGNNSISRLDETFFDNLLQLKFLNLSKNQIEFISDSIFSPLINLEVLDLGFNRLTFISNYALRNQIFIKDLYLNGNAKLDFDELSLYGLESITNLFVSVNIFDDVSKRNILLNSLKPVSLGSINNVPYYRSINLLYDYETGNRHVDCSIVIEFAKSNLQINLKTDYHLTSFLYFCFDIDIYIE